MQQVEEHLGDISIRCNSRLLEKSIANSTSIDKDSGARGKNEGVSQ